MADDRKGFLTPEQEQKIDGLIQLSGIAETFDGMAIRLADNIGLEALKVKIPEDVLPVVLDIIDQIMAAIPEAE